MSFFDYLEKIQSKSEEERRLVLWVATLSIFTVIFAVWLSSIDISINTDENIIDKEESGELSPIESLKQISAGVADDIKRGYGVFIESLAGEGDTAVEEIDSTDEDEVGEGVYQSADGKSGLSNDLNNLSEEVVKPPPAGNAEMETATATATEPTMPEYNEEEI